MCVCGGVRERRVRKRYRAVCVGVLMSPEGTVEEPVSGKDAATKYKAVDCTPSARYGNT